MHLEETEQLETPVRRDVLVLRVALVLLEPLGLLVILGLLESEVKLAQLDGPGQLVLLEQSVPLGNAVNAIHNTLICYLNIFETLILNYRVRMIVFSC